MTALTKKRKTTEQREKRAGSINHFTYKGKVIDDTRRVLVTKDTFTGKKYSIAKLTSKGQVTIPVAIRKSMGLKDGDEIFFVYNNGNTQIKKMTAIDRLALSIGPKLREEFPTPEAFDAYLKANRKNIIEKIYGNCDTESSD
jgi:AbrB family looped-hinge helix DNA binding protein